MKSTDITELLQDLQSGREEAKNDLFESVYLELKKTAKSVRKKWRGNVTLNTTALVHETYIKMVPEKVDWQSRLHFFCIAGKVMRQILYNYIEKQHAQKRGGKKADINVEEVKDFIMLDDKSFLEIYCLENVLKQLETQDLIYGRIVECRFYGGMTIQETAHVLNISAATVKRKWNFARSWLFQEIKNAS